MCITKKSNLVAVEITATKQENCCGLTTCHYLLAVVCQPLLFSGGFIITATK